MFYNINIKILFIYFLYIDDEDMNDFDTKEDNQHNLHE